MEYCINKNTNEKIFAFDVENEYGIKDLGIERKLRLGGEREELICPECKTPVILRAGEIKIPHFAHKIKTKECFYSTYTYNENREKALKILYDLLKKFEDIEILDITKKFSENGVIDILIEVKSYYLGKNTKHAILLKNTNDSYEKWGNFKNELLTNGITPIYFNYGTTKELKNFKEKVDKYFFFRNLVHLSGNKGIRYINIETHSFNSITAKIYLDDKNIIKGYEYQMQEVKYEDFIDIFFNQIYTMEYIFDFDCKKEMDNLDKVIGYDPKYNSCNKGFTPFFLISNLGYIFLVVAINATSYSYNEELNPLEFEVIDFNFFLSKPRFYYNCIYYYPYYELLKDSNYLELNNEEDEDELQEFLEDKSDLGKFKIISLENIGSMRKYIDEFIEIVEVIKSKILSFDFIGEEAKKIFDMQEILVDLDNNNSSLEKSKENLERLKNIFNSLFVVSFPKKYWKDLYNKIEDEIFANRKTELIEKLYDIFNKLKDVENEEIKILLHFKEITDYEISKLFLEVFGNHFLPNHHYYIDFEKNIKISLYFAFWELELEMLNTYYKVKKYFMPLNFKEIQLKKFNSYITDYFKDNNFQFFIYRIEKDIKEEYLEEFFIKNFEFIVKEEKVEIIELFLNKGFDVNKTIIEKQLNELVIIMEKMSTYNLEIRYSSLQSWILGTSNLKLITLLEKYGYNFNLNHVELAKVLCRYFESDEEYTKSFIKNKINLNEIYSKNKITLFYQICSHSSNFKIINYCIKLGANLYAKSKKGYTPLNILESKIRNGTLNKNDLDIN